ncbi:MULTISPECIES: type II toxin-antitoxin system HicA family toxin [Lactobacillaceae]|uniref:type II toxin-antitoxin system HicA family toxin n=1 Tax=Lactobacillaceae TaxID=33958 RepID=UPI0007A0BD1E|nr:MULTISPECIES: type II toxin-antitoxin system HicA family toxin [Lactobacillaceae]
MVNVANTRKTTTNCFSQGFILQKSKGKGGHRRYLHPDGRTTEIPFHAGEVSRSTKRKVLEQIGFTVQV